MIKASNGMRKIGIDLRKKLFASVTSAFGGKLEMIICGGAALNQDIIDTFEGIGIVILNGYGITECAPLISCNRNEYRKKGSVGVPIIGEKVKIADPNENGEGEICVKGPHVMLGYYKNEEETNRVIVDGWFNTEDLGYIDEQGRILVTGRSKNLIVLKNGKNIFPEEIEKYIQAIPYVAEVAVTSVKNDDGDEVGLCAHVYPDQASEEAKDPALEEKLRKDIALACKPLPKYKQINRIKIRDKEFVKTTSNKIRRNKIEC
jgi:long-chain acyl-CoA synthetase